MSSVKVYGVPASQNCAGPIILAMEAKAGGMEYVDMMTGGHKTAEYGAVNPYLKVPAMSDGDVKIGQSIAILRYLAIKYLPAAYPTSDPAKCAKIDFATDCMNDFIYPHHLKTVYGVLGKAAQSSCSTAARCHRSHASKTCPLPIHRFQTTRRGQRQASQLLQRLR